MTARRRAPRTLEQRQAQWTRSMTPGTLAGNVANAAPIVPGLFAGRAEGRAVAAAFGGGSTGTVLAFQDVFDLTAAGAQTRELTYLPLLNSEHVYLNGLYQREVADWSRSGQTLSVLSGMDARAGDVLAVEYLYASAVTDTPTDAAGLGPSVIGKPWLAYAFSGGTAYDAWFRLNALIPATVELSTRFYQGASLGDAITPAAVVAGSPYGPTIYHGSQTRPAYGAPGPTSLRLQILGNASDIDAAWPGWRTSPGYNSGIFFDNVACSTGHTTAPPSSYDGTGL